METAAGINTSSNKCRKSYYPWCWCCRTSSAKGGVPCPTAMKIQAWRQFEEQDRILLDEREQKRETGTLARPESVPQHFCQAAQILGSTQEEEGQAPPCCKRHELPKSPPQCAGRLEFLWGPLPTWLSQWQSFLGDLLSSRHHMNITSSAPSIILWNICYY